MKSVSMYFNTLKRLGEFDHLPLCGFFKNVSSREKETPWFLVIFDIIISHIFPENFIEIFRVVQKISAFPCYEETNDVSIYQMMLAFFTFNLL